MLRPGRGPAAIDASYFKLARWLRSSGLALVLAWILMLVVGIAGYWTNTAMVQVAAERAANARQMGAVSKLVTDVGDAETGQRGFLLTGREEYLAPYDRAVAAVPEDLQRLQALAGDSGPVAAAMPAMTRLVSSKMDELALTIRLRRQEGLDAALAVVVTDRGKHYFDELRGVAATVHDAIQASGEAHERATERQAARSILAILAGNVTGLVFLSFAAVSAQRDARSRREAEQRARAIVDSAPDPVVIVNDKSEICQINSQTERLFGYASDELIGQPFELLIPAGRRALNRDTRSTGQALQLRGVRKDGSEVPVELSLGPFTIDGHSFVSSAVRDVTERDRINEELRQSVFLAQEASKAKSEFLANMSHEIRTPMNGIVGMAELLRATPLTREQSEYVGLIGESSDSLLEIINSILDFSKIEAGHVELDERPLTLREGLGNILRTLAARAHKKGIELAFRVVPEVPERLVGDAGRLRQILVNLVGNAIKFTERGEVVVSVSLDRADEQRVVLRFVVKDTGIGIPADKLGIIFDAFSQVEASAERRFEGTGLGLAISSKLVALMGGSISVDSEPGKGSTFAFTVTLRRDRTQLAESLRPGPVDLAGLPVLVVDDNGTNRQILHEILVGWGTVPTSVASGPEAVEAFEAAQAQGRPFALALFDVAMPGMDGFALARHLRQSPGGQKMVLVMLSSSATAPSQALVDELAIALVLTKPIKQSELFDAIRQALASASVSKGAPPPARLAVGHGLDILVAEDNSVNQLVIRRLLESAGHRVTMAQDGREALEAVEGHRFDVVLMDMQMPRVSGDQALGLIRARDQVRRIHTPVVVVTAHALKGDREKYLALGADGYVSKPIDKAQLLRVIGEVAPSTPRPAAPGSPVPVASTSPAVPSPVVASVPEAPKAPPSNVYDREALLRQTQGNDALVAELARLLATDSGELMARIHEAAAKADTAALRMAAHTLKGAVANFRAFDATAAAMALENAARQGQVSSDLIVRLDREMGRLLRALEVA